MGVIALGIGFATPLALTGVAIHIAGHAIAKALGFYAATPLLGHERRAGGHAVTGIARTEPTLGAAMGISLGTLAGLPPSPLFVSELLIVAGGFEAGWPWAAARRRTPARARIRRPGPRADRDDRRLPTPPRRRRDPGPPRPPPAHRGRRRAAPRPHARRAAAHRHRPSSTRSRRESPERRPHTEPAAYRAAVEEALATGWRFAGLHASAQRLARAGAARRPDGTTRLETLATPDREAVSLVDLAPRRAGTSARRTTSTASPSPATSRSARSSTTRPRSPPGRCRCTATTPTRSPSGRSTPA